MQGLAANLQWNLPLAIARLETMIRSLEAYMELKEPQPSEMAVNELPADGTVVPPGTAGEPDGQSPA